MKIKLITVGMVIAAIAVALAFKTADLKKDSPAENHNIEEEKVSVTSLLEYVLK